MFKHMLVLVFLLPFLGGCIISSRGGHGWPGGHGGHRMHGGHSATIIVPPVPVVRVR